jgi:hypothetical protein
MTMDYLESEIADIRKDLEVHKAAEEVRWDSNEYRLHSLNDMKTREKDMLPRSEYQVSHAHLIEAIRQRTEYMDRRLRQAELKIAYASGGVALFSLLVGVVVFYLKH